MKTFQSDTHRAELSHDGILNVFPLEDRKIKEVAFNGDKVRVAEHTAKSGSPALRDLLVAMENTPVFRAAFAQNDVFHVDYEAGASRCKGYKTTEEVRDALYKCKFSSKEVELILRRCQQTNHPFLPKVG